MKNYKLTINKNQYEVDILSVEDNYAKVNVNGTVYEVELDKKIRSSKTPILVRSNVSPSTDSTPTTSKTSSPSAPKGAGTIKSPLPGTIISIHVNIGDSVKIGTKLITLEAMKMENNINSDKEGIVSGIKVKKGDSVLEGDILITIGG